MEIRIQHGGCQVKLIEPKLGQQHTSPDAGEKKNLIGQWPGSNSSVKKLLLLIFKVSILLCSGSYYVTSGITEV